VSIAALKILNMKCGFCRSGSTDTSANEQASTMSVEDSISQTAKLNLYGSSSAESGVKTSLSDEAKKTEIPMPSGPKTR